MKRKIKFFCKGVLAVGLVGGLFVNFIVSAGADTFKNSTEPKVTHAPDIGQIDPDLYINKKPSDEEIKAAADLKQIVQKWIEDETYPDIFQSCRLYGVYQERVVIVLTDASEETKQKFLKLTGVTPTQYWHFYEGRFSRSELIAIRDEIKKKYAGDERIKNNIISLNDALIYEAPGGTPNYVIDQNLNNDSKDWGSRVIVCGANEDAVIKLKEELEQKYGDAVSVSGWAEAPVLVVPYAKTLKDVQKLLRISLGLEEGTKITLKEVQNALRQVLNLETKF